MSRPKDTGPDAAPPGIQALPENRFGRRAFLLGGGAAAATAAVLLGLPPALRKELTRENSFVLFSARQGQTVIAVQEHLFPHLPDSPGAIDINALAYLKQAITAPGIGPDTPNVIVNGLGQLQDACLERFDIFFDEASFEQREPLLRYLADETRWGRAWLSLLMYYILEALLSDPVYGGNPNGVGWRWLEHQPGFPRPPADKVYGKL